QDYPKSIAVDASGNAYIAGQASSTNFSTTPGAFQTTYGGGTYDTFVTKLNSTGSALVYSTYLGGNSEEEFGGLAVDAFGNAYVTGPTFSPNFPTTPGAFQTTFNGARSDAYVTKLNPTGSALVYSTYLGGSAECGSSGMAVDASDNAWIVGGTQATNDFPTTPDAFQPTFGGGSGDGFVTKLNPTGSALVYSTYLGGNSVDSPIAIALDASGNAFVTGQITSTDFPTTSGAFQTTNGGGTDAFVAKFAHVYSAQVQQPINPDGSSVFSVKRGVVPVKFTLTQDGASTCTLPPATIALTRTAGGTIGSVNESTYIAQADSGSNFRIDSCQYVYNLNAGGLGVGTYRVDIKINDIVAGNAIFQLK